MKGKDVDELRSLLTSLKKKAREDPKLDYEKFDQLMKNIHFLEGVLTKYADLKDKDIEEARVRSEKSTRLFAVLDKLSNERYPSYVDEFVRALAKPPFTLPSNLFQPEGEITVFVDVSGLRRARTRLQEERGENAIDMLFPGSVTHRYFGEPVKVDTGKWHKDFTCRLRGIHELSENPIFQIEADGRTVDVYQPKRLRARRIPRGSLVCLTCLALSMTDEQCDHSRAWRRMRPPSAASIKVRQEIARKVRDTKTVHAPLESIIKQVDFLESLEVGVAAIGFERYRAGTTVTVNYNPPIGLKLKTRGVALKLKIPDAFIERLLSKKYIVRDLVIQILANELRSIMRRVGVPSYDFQPLMSGLIGALSLDDQNEIGKLEEDIRSDRWVEEAITAIDNERHLLERFEVSPERIELIYHRLRDTRVGEIIRDEIRKRLIHSLAHAMLIAGCVTSGSTFDDLDYLVGRDEIILFDSVNGGNGSSEMIFEFLASEEKFSIGTFVEELVKGRIYKPKYFAEALMELLLPCPQGVAERIFNKELPTPTYLEISRRIEQLRERESPSTIDVTEFFPSSIGYHRVADSTDIQTAERRREVFDICVHGCPDCISIGNRCETGSFAEKYNISKIMIDEFFKYATDAFTADIDSGRENIEKKLKGKGTVIVRQRIYSDKDEERLMALALGLDGTELGDRYVSFAGFWIDCSPDATSVDYSIMLMLI